MSIFTKDILLHNNGGGTFTLGESFEYYLESVPSVVIKFEKGLIYNGANTPKWARWLFPRFGKYDKAVMLHDFLYGSHKTSRKVADSEFLYAMKILGISRIKRYTMYYSVRIFGKKWW